MYPWGFGCGNPVQSSLGSVAGVEHSVRTSLYNNMATSKRQRTTDSDDFDTEVELDNWPRFLVIQASNPDLPLSKLSPFAVQKGIEGMAGNPALIERKITDS